MRLAVTYCLIPSDLAPALHDVLRTHFRDDPEVEVVVEQRGRERRTGAERRREEAEAPEAGERRRIRGAGGRRVGERRARQLALEVEPPRLPRRARRHAERITFVRWLEPSGQEAEDLDTARLVTRFQAGEGDEAFTALYRRYFDRVYGYLRLVLRDAHEAEDSTQQVFIKVFEKLGGYERRHQPFRAWLFRIARNHAISELRKQGALATEPEALDRRREEAAGNAEPDPRTIRWLSERDFITLIDRLPVAQRQVLALRYMLDLDTNQIATVMDRNAGSVRALQHRALRALEGRVTALGYAPRRSDRASRMRRFPKRAPVIRSRRYALMR